MRWKRGSRRWKLLNRKPLHIKGTDQGRAMARRQVDHINLLPGRQVSASYAVISVDLMITAWTSMSETSNSSFESKGSGSTLTRKRESVLTSTQKAVDVRSANLSTVAPVAVQLGF